MSAISTFLDAESEKLDSWADDLKLGLEVQLKELEKKIKEVRRSASAALTLEEKLAVQKEVRALESLRNDKRKAGDRGAGRRRRRRRGELIEQIEAKLRQRPRSRNCSPSGGRSARERPGSPSWFDPMIEST